MKEKIVGSVMWYQPHRGFGYIKGDDGVEYFIYHSDILMDGFRQLRKDQRVKFIPGETEKGPLAKEAEVIE